MKYALLAALALGFAGLTLAADPEVNDTPDAASAKVQTQEPPRAGHYVTICDGRSCRQVWVPDAKTLAASNLEVVAVAPPAAFYPLGSPRYAVSGDGAVTETRVRFMHRGPVRRFFSRR